MVATALESILGIIIFLAVVLIGIAVASQRKLSTRRTNIDDHPRYGPRRRSGIAGGYANHENRKIRAQEDATIHLAKQIPGRWQRRAAAGSARHQQLVDDANSLINKEVRIIDKLFTIKDRPPKGAPKVHPSTGQNVPGIRRGVVQRPQRTSWRSKKNDK